MSGILTLFGEETPPEELNAVGKSRAKAKPKEEAPAAPRPKEKAESKPDLRPPVPPRQPVAPPPAKEKEPRPVYVAKKIAKPAKAPKAEKEPAEPLPESWEADKQYYSIGEVSGMFRVATSHIRFWTKEFDMKVRTTRKGDRLYTPEQIKELRVIYNLVKEKGYTIKGAKEKLKTTKKTAVETVDLKQSLLQLRNKLLNIRNQLA